MDLPIEIDPDFQQHFEATLAAYDQKHRGSQKKPWTSEKIIEVMNNIRQARATTHSSKRKTPMEYYWMSKYDILTDEGGDYLVFKNKTPAEPTVRILPRSDYFAAISEVHESCGHGGRDKIINAIKTRFYIPKKAIEIFVSLCPTCEAKKSTKKGSEVRQKAQLPSDEQSKDFNFRGQVDLVDYQYCPDGDLKWLLTYQDHATKFVSLRPIRSNEAHEVALELLKIFMTFGTPCILQSDSGREFTAEVVEELIALWPECRIVHGDPQTQGNVETTSEEVENLMKSWMINNNSTNWALGCYRVQYSINSLCQRGIGKSPYKALFGSEPKAGLSSSSIPDSFLVNIKTEEQLNDLSQQDLSNNYPEQGPSCSFVKCESNANDFANSPEQPNDNLTEDPLFNESPGGGLGFAGQVELVNDQNQIATYSVRGRFLRI